MEITTLTGMQQKPYSGWCSGVKPYNSDSHAQSICIDDALNGTVSFIGNIRKCTTDGYCCVCNVN